MTEDSHNYPLAAPGWQAIDQRLGLFYPHQIPHQYTSQTPYELDSKNPLPAIAVYEASAPLYFHYVTYGLTELFEKSSHHLDISGFGFELSFRLRGDSSAQKPPEWVVAFLQSIAHYVLSGHTLDSGHCIDFAAPLHQASQLTGVLCLPDPQLGKIATPHGSVLFLLLIGLTSDELERVQTWPLERKVAWAAQAFPENITDLHRRSTRLDPETAPLFRRYDLGILLE